ncbi:MAG: class I fructose-bisphosphate aldolase, partial [Thermoanaerobaculia bacterium]|nr:class I fructose-bisphosphate aldolase [Thermoanaerobaculia bacterium]
MTTTIDQITERLGDEAESLLNHVCEGIPKEMLHLPGPDHVDAVFGPSDRGPRTLVNLQRLFDHGRLGGTGYVSILPVDQGIEHSAAASFAPHPELFDPEAIIQLAIEGGCNGVASTLGVLGSLARRYAHKIPFVVKINHNELLSYPNTYRQTLFSSVERAWDLGACAVGATIYFGSDDFHRELEEISQCFEQAHELGMGTILWCYLRNQEFKKDGVDHHSSADLTGQANHLGATIEADIIKQKQATQNGGYTALGFGKTHPMVYEKLTTDHPIDLVRWQVANCYMGRVGM